MIENALKCLLWVNYFPFELTIKLILNRQTIMYYFCPILAQWFAQCFLILEYILHITKTLHYFILQKEHKFFIHLFNMKTEKSTEVFQKEKHTDTKIFIAKRRIKDEVLRDKDYTHKTRAAVLINQWKLNGSWAPSKNVSTSKRGDNSLFCLIKKKNLLTYMPCYSATLQICKPLYEVQMDAADKNVHRIITQNHYIF